MNVIGFDADDTLWRNEDLFRDAEAYFAELVAPHAHDPDNVLDILRRIEIGNVSLTGYGIKPYALSMVEAAIEATTGSVPATTIRQLITHAYDMLRLPVELLDGVASTLEALSESRRLVLLTKGDLLDQRRKIESSGLQHYFEHVEVLHEKDASTYRTVLARCGISPDEFVMVGNSVKSDILPIIELGGRAVHIPYHVTWEHEVTHRHDADFAELSSIAELPAWLAAESL
jgi:putative hydrolase of the HAD superfamily